MNHLRKINYSNLFYRYLIGSSVGGAVVGSGYTMFGLATDPYERHSPIDYCFCLPLGMMLGSFMTTTSPLWVPPFLAGNALWEKRNQSH